MASLIVVGCLTKKIETWFIQVFVPQTQEMCSVFTRVLLYDGHNSHITYPTIKAAIDNNVVIVCLPPNTSHALQPLDVAVFRSVKLKWGEICQAWFKDSRIKSVDKSSFPALLKKLWEQLNPQHAVNGFRKTGLFPFNRNAVDNKILNSVSDPLIQASVGPRSLERVLISSICDVLKPKETPEVQAALANRARKRTRLQCKHGEVLTAPDVEKRLLEEQIERERKKNKQPAKAKAGKGVSITMKPVSQPTGKNATKSTKATTMLEHFGKASTSGTTPILVQKDMTKKIVSDQKASDSGTTLIMVQKDMQDLVVRKVSEKKKEASVYMDISTEDSDPDDPAPQAPQLLDKSSIKNLKPGASYVIYNCEGSFFPGLVTKITKSKIVVKTMAKSGLTTWSWPATDDLHDCKYTDLVEIISPPKLSNNRGKGYFVPRIADYWKF